MGGRIGYSQGTGDREHTRCGGVKEGWNVRNVATIVWLRAYTAESSILPEQTLGRGLRRMYSAVPVNPG
jgi:superfamily II DNA or RNA helicase